MAATPLARRINASALTDLLAEWRSAPGGRRPPSYRELADRIELLIVDGRLPAGSRLPAERDIAVALGVSRTTASGAYRELGRRGLLTTVRGSGSVVAIRAGAPRRPDIRTTAIADLSHATLPGWEELPGHFAAATEQLPALLRTHALDFYGLPDLRGALAERYTRRGLPTVPAQVLVTLGAQHALALVLRAVVNPGDRIAVDVPSYPHALDAFRDARARLVPVPLRGDGVDAGEWEQALLAAQPALAYVMPDFQNPTGSSMTDDDRERLLDTATRTGTVLISDETTAELDIDRDFTTAPLTSRRGRAAVINIGSASKTMWHGLRVGWIRAETALIDRIAARRPASDLGTPVLEQLVVASVLPDMDRLLAARRRHLRTTRDGVLEHLARDLPEWRTPIVHGGLCLWTNIGSPTSSALAMAARARGLTITSGPRFGLDGALERSLRIPITGHLDSTIAAVELLIETWRTLPPADLHRGAEFSPML